jgi:hypothetical protein
MRFVFDDGGRKVAGYQGEAGDCVCRAIAIAAGLPYQEVYDALFAGIRRLREGRSRAAKRARHGSPRAGVSSKVYRPYLEGLGFRWVPTMGIGSGCRLHLADGELPPGRLVVRVSGHMTAVLDGVIHDTYNPQRGGRRCVYGYFQKAEKEADISEGGRGMADKDYILSFAHCKRCLAELPEDQSPREYQRIQVGWTRRGVQVWCVRHECNVMHIDFEGHKHPLIAGTDPAEN